MGERTVELKTMTVHQRMLAVMQEIGFIGKDRKAPEMAGGYNFRGIDDFYEKLQPALIKCGLYVLPRVIDTKREIVQTKSGPANVSILTIEYTFIGEDGDSVTATVVGEGSDRLDKACNKAMSSAFKYMASQAWCVPTNDPTLDTEANDDEPEPVKPKAEAKKPAKKDDSAKEKEWYQTLKATLQGLCNVDGANAVCESVLLLDKQSSQLPPNTDPVVHTLLAVLDKRGVTVTKTGPTGLTDVIGNDVLALFSRYTKVDET